MQPTVYPSVDLKEYLERMHTDYVQAHRHEHDAHAAAHEREHQLNKDAIDKAEGSVEKAVAAARETVGADLKALAERMTRSEEERRRQLEDMKESIRMMGLELAAIRSVSEGSVKSVQAIQDSQTWIVRLVIGVIVLAVMAWIIRPTLL